MCDEQGNPELGLEPIYSNQINQPITLYNGPCELGLPESSISANVHLYYAWRPNGGPEVEVLLPSFIPSLNLMNGFSLRISALGLILGITGRRMTTSTNGVTRLWGLVEGRLRYGQQTGLTKMKFHVVNFQAVRGAHLRRGNNRIAGRIELANANWRIQVDPVEGHGINQEFSQTLDDTKGYGITHIGCISKNDNSEFSADDCEPLLVALGKTLSFAGAVYTYPILWCGYSQTGTIVFRDWSRCRIDAYQNNTTWFSGSPPLGLQEVFNGWLQLSSHPDYETIVAAWGMYMDSHSPSVSQESELVIAQAALEGIETGWNFPPMNNFTTAPVFNPSATAADRIWSVANSLGMAPTAPQHFVQLNALAHPTPNAPVLEKVTWVRNSIAHLGNYPRLANQHDLVVYESWLYAVWLLELALLRLLDFPGPYQNRIAVQHHVQVEPVPWIRIPQGP